MIEITSQLQSKEFGQDQFGDGSFGWTPVGKIELSRLLERVNKVDLNVEIIVVSKQRKNLTGLGRAKNSWSKAQGGARNVFFDPAKTDISIKLITESVLNVVDSVTNSLNPIMFVESELISKINSTTGLSCNSSINNIKILCY